MRSTITCKRLSISACLIATAALTSPVFAKSPHSAGTAAEKPTVVKLFDGIKTGDLKVRVLAKNEFEAKVWITNTTAKPLTVQLPKAVAAVHVLKQIQLPGGQNPFQLNGPNNNQNGNGRGQAIGGNFNNQGNQGFGQNFGPQNGQNPFGNNGFFSVASQKSIQLPLHTVCLNHGKPTPNIRMTYELRPVETVVSSPALQRVLAEYNPQKDDRMSLQAAAWHLANGMSWKDLQSKSRRRLGGLGPKRIFSRKQLYYAFEIVKAAKSTTQDDEAKSIRLSSRSVR